MTLPRHSWVIAFLATLSPFIAMADQPPNALEIEARVERAMIAEVTTHCVGGNDFDRASCFRERLDALDSMLADLIENAIARTKNVSGAEATAEQRQNIREAQAAWKTYRHEQCWFSYVAHQSINASSRQLDNIACEIRRTLRRTEEVKIDYMGEWR